MSGHTHIHTRIHTYTHTYTHDNYYNPRCAHAHRGLIMLYANVLLHRCYTVAYNNVICKYIVKHCHLQVAAVMLPPHLAISTFILP